MTFMRVETGLAPAPTRGMWMNVICRTACKEYKLPFTHPDPRRNLLTAGVPLNHLVGKTFRVGEVVLRGIELCEPCGHLEKLTCAGIKRALIHRGGLRAQILRGGELRV